MEDNQIFRQESIDRISSPERLQDYIRVTNPGIWIVLLAVIAMLVGILAVSCLQKLETKLPVEVSAVGGNITVTMPRDEGSEIKEGMPLRVADQETTLDFVYQSDSRHISASAKLSIPDGKYDGDIVVESVAPITFLLN